MIPRLQAILALFLVIVGISGCIHGDASPEGLESGYFSPLSQGTSIRVTEQSFVGFEEGEWVLSNVEKGMNRYGVFETMAVFTSIDSNIAIQTVSKDLGHLEISHDEIIGWPSLYTSTYCNMPHPTELLALLSDTSVPTINQPFTYRGQHAVLNITGTTHETQLTIQGDKVNISANVSAVSGELVGRVLLEAQAGPRPGCYERLTQAADVFIEPGNEEDVDLEFGISVSPHEATAATWPPDFGLDSADFSLRRAAERLETDPRYQEFSSGETVWPVKLKYHDEGCVDGPIWAWEIHLMREDSRVFYACVIMVKDVENLPIEFVVWAEEPEGNFYHVGPVNWVDLQILDDVVAHYSEGQAEQLTRFDFEIYNDHNGKEVPWINIQRADPRQESVDFRCDFQGFEGRILSCSNIDSGIVS